MKFHGFDLSGLHKEVPIEILPKELGQIKQTNKFIKRYFDLSACSGTQEFSNEDIVNAAKKKEDHFQELIKIALTLQDEPSPSFDCLDVVFCLWCVHPAPGDPGPDSQTHANYQTNKYKTNIKH